jgi:hypothetical protein
MNAQELLVVVAWQLLLEASHVGGDDAACPAGLD